MRVTPTTLAEANAFVTEHHRHHKPVIGHKASIAASNDGVVVGVAILSRPVARHADDGWTVEITRLCTDGTRNAASFLLGASRRLGFALGYMRVITYTLSEEGGASLRGAGFRVLGEAGGGSWSRKDRPRVDKHPLQVKIKWESNT
jgi:hypothetical protein